MKQDAQLMEIWGDTVDRRHLALAILIGGAIAMAGFIASRALLRQVVADQAMAASYAMLVGLGGCLIAGIICAKLFAPKRQIIEEGEDPSWRESAMDELATDTGGLGRLADLPPEVIAEMKDVGLYDIFAQRERAADAAAASSSTPDAGRTAAAAH
ncbi:hypothetical protein [Pigmentiphaga aceris]|uniref:hypothetical protein n=1 Tax=Pigmentiphaga aceris TaxID=1940612 RepID=UPI001FE3B1D2|nr:hypothetical protein [Pigmentiphaga aceris]